MKLRPLHDKVIVRRDEPETYKGNIVLPDSAKEKPRIGEVLAVGPGKRMESGEVAVMNLRRGDRVLFSAYAGVEHEVGGEKVRIMTEDDVLGTVE